MAYFLSEMRQPLGPDVPAIVPRVPCRRGLAKCRHGPRLLSGPPARPGPRRARSQGWRWVGQWQGHGIPTPRPPSADSGSMQRCSPATLRRAVPLSLSEHRPRSPPNSPCGTPPSCRTTSIPVCPDYTQTGVVLTLGSRVYCPGALRRHLQHEVRRLPLLRDHISLAPVVRLRVHPKSHQQVGIPHPGQAPGGSQRKIMLSRHQRRLSVPQVVDEAVGIPGGRKLVILPSGSSGGSGNTMCSRTCGVLANVSGVVIVHPTVGPELPPSSARSSAVQSDGVSTPRPLQHGIRLLASFHYICPVRGKQVFCLPLALRKRPELDLQLEGNCEGS